MLRRTATINRLTPSDEKDDYGNPVLEPETVTARCDLQLQAATESTDEIPRGTYVLFLPPGTALTAADRVTIDGLDYEVVGPPFEEPGSHVMAGLERA